MKRWIVRLFVGLALALPVGLFTFALAQAQALPPQQPAAEAACEVCHPDTAAVWEDSAHGHAVSSPTFQEAWQGQDSPRECLTCHTTGYDSAKDTYAAEGVTCQACHNPLNPNHPKEPMPSDRSAALCGSCHTATTFEWQVSRHRQSDLSCVDCHNPHATDLKAGE